MNRYRLVREMRQCVFAVCVFAVLTLPVRGQISFGGLSGVARDSASGKPLADAQIIAHDMRKNTESTAASSSNGAFVIAVEPGWYEVTATKNGYLKATARIHVVSGRTAELELPLAFNHAALESAMMQELESMKARVGQLETELKAQKAQESAKASAPPANDVLLASVAKDSNQMPALPSAPPKPDDRELLALERAACNGCSRCPQPAAPAAPPAPRPFQKPCKRPIRLPRWTTSLPSRSATSPGSTALRATKTRCWTPNSSLRKIDSTLTTWRTSTSRSITPSSARPSRSDPVKFRWSRSASAAISTGRMCAAACSTWMACLPPPLRAMTPARRLANGISANAYKYVSEAYGGYHFNVNHGLNVDAGIFVSYIGLFSYYNFDNWTYQPSYVSSNTPWFFNGVRVQWFPTAS